MEGKISNHNALSNLIQEAKSHLFSEEDIEKWRQILTHLFDSKERLPYSQLTLSIYDLNCSEELDNVQSNFSRVMDRTIQWDLDDNQTITEQLKKIEDHIQLAITQRGFILNNIYDLESKLYEKETELNEFKLKLN